VNLITTDMFALDIYSALGIVGSIAVIVAYLPRKPANSAPKIRASPWPTS